ncbi:MAG: hypothetical protein D6773_01370, partial [Alphaproteobacteria bacterium]
MSLTRINCRLAQARALSGEPEARNVLLPAGAVSAASRFADNFLQQAVDGLLCRFRLVGAVLVEFTEADVNGAGL